MPTAPPRPGPAETARAGAVLRAAERPVADRGNGARTYQLVTPSCGATQLLNGVTSFDPGAQIGLHWHNCEESVLVLEGEAVCVIDGAEHRLVAGDASWLPAGVPHYFRNPSADSVLRIFWTYASSTATRTLAATGEERPVAAEHPGARG